MNELQEVIATADELDSGDRSWALATIVSVQGSTYRRPGARLIVRDDNSWVGNLSGGCLEGEVLELGGRVMDDGHARRALYDLTADEEAIWGWGLGCNGAIDVFVEPATTARSHLDLLSKGRATGRPFRLVTVVGPEGSDELACHGLLERDSVAGDLPDEVVAAGQASVATGLVAAGDLEIYVEHVASPLRLLVCGAGHDAVPLVARAALLGWEVVVVDDRSSFLDEQRFPGAMKLVHTPPREAAVAAGADEYSAAVVMSHNFLRDADYLASLAPVRMGYVGMLGPGQRLARLVDHLASQGIELDRDDLATVRGPAGLDLGAEGPDEIAVSIVSEILAVRRGRAAGFLSDRTGSIHPEQQPTG